LAVAGVAGAPLVLAVAPVSDHVPQRLAEPNLAPLVILSIEYHPARQLKVHARNAAQRRICEHPA
jgi:hypothetical protein